MAKAQMKPNRDDSDTPRPRLIITKKQRLPLGDMLQRLAHISPHDLYAITRLVRDVLKHAEVRHKRLHPPANDADLH
jgi:hypothetical protein